ncbi:hypothetical protein MHBO_002601 [Bonamia ostreae]|uniref:RNA polymerase sigma factor 70 region 4 type 2 domain-containing protein n=1 Tax=Bonamia ostreae TaxID=126728 RepID=A0ABV2AMX4_9EUKA
MKQTEIYLLIEDAKKGKQVAFTKLYEQYKNLAFYVARKYLRNSDAVSEAVNIGMSYFFRNINDVKEDSNVMNFVWHHIKYASMDYHRRERTHENHYSDTHNDEDFYLETFIDSSESALDSIMVKEKSNMAISAIEKLDSVRKELITLKYLQEYSNDEIAEIYGKTKWTVKGHLAKGRESLRNILNEQVIREYYSVA